MFSPGFCLDSRHAAALEALQIATRAVQAGDSTAVHVVCASLAPRMIASAAHKYSGEAAPSPSAEGSSAIDREDRKRQQAAR